VGGGSKMWVNCVRSLASIFAYCSSLVRVCMHLVIAARISVSCTHICYVTVGTMHLTWAKSLVV